MVSGAAAQDPDEKALHKKLKPLTYLKYAVLLVMVILLPAFLVNDVGMGDPYFCKYLCPQGVLEGAIPLSLANAGIRAALGKLFTWKLCVLISVVVLSVLFLPPVLQMALPAGRVLRLAEQGIPFPDEGRWKQMRLLREMRQSLQDGCGCDEDAQSYRVHPLRNVSAPVPQTP